MVTVPLLSHVSMSMLCLIGGGGSTPIGVPGLFLAFCCCSLAGLLAIAAQDVGLGGGIPIGVATAAATLPPPPMTEPALFTPEPLPATSPPIFRPSMPCSRLFIPGALLSVSLWKPVWPSGTKVPPKELGG